MTPFGGMNRLNTNIQSMRSRQTLNRINKKIAGNQLRLSTGKKINRAEDNAAGLSIATKLDSRIVGLQQSLNNIGDAKSMLNIADKGYQTTSDILVDLKRLSTQAASESIGEAERGYIGEKITALANEINEVANQSVYQGVELLNGELDATTGKPTYVQNRSVTFQTGERTKDVTSVDLKAVSVNELFPERVRDNGELMPDIKYRVNEIQTKIGANITTTTVNPPIELSSLSSFDKPKEFVDAFNNGGISGVTASKDGSKVQFVNQNAEPVEINYFDSRDSLPVPGSINLAAATDDGAGNITPSQRSVHLPNKEWPVDTIFIKDKANNSFVQYDIDSYTVKNVSKLLHEDLNMEHIKVMEEHGEIKLENTDLYNEEVIKLGVKEPGTGDIIAKSDAQILPKAVIPKNVQGEIDTSGWPPSEYRIFSTEIDEAINKMGNRTNTLGTVQNSLSNQEELVTQSVISNESAKSRIMDTDFAKAQSESVRLQILQQTATSSLAQANNGPQSVLGFIGG